MSLLYRAMYRVGVMPWEHTEPPEPLVELIEGSAALPPGDMLDVGCGTGRDAIYVARHGWNVTGVDAAPEALARARRNASDAGVNVRFLQADIARAATGDLGGPYTLLTDFGCIHGLTPAQRDHAAAAITEVAQTGATLLMLAFAPGRRGPLPHGLDVAQITALLPQWDLVTSGPATDVTLKGPVRNADPHWHQLVKR
jgi:SAM-dependent methyltransferase